MRKVAVLSIAGATLAFGSGWSILQGIKYYEVLSDRLLCNKEAKLSHIADIVLRLQMVVTSTRMATFFHHV